MIISSSCMSTKQVCKDYFTPVHASLHDVVFGSDEWDIGFDIILFSTVLCKIKPSLKQNRILACYSLKHFTRLLLTIGILLVTLDTTPP